MEPRKQDLVWCPKLPLQSCGGCQEWIWGREQAPYLVSPDLVAHSDFCGISLSPCCVSDSCPPVQHTTAEETASLPR